MMDSHTLGLKRRPFQAVETRFVDSLHPTPAVFFSPVFSFPSSMLFLAFFPVLLPSHSF